MPVRHDADGPQPCLRRRSPPRKRSARRAPGASHCWGWMGVGRALADRLMTILAFVETPSWVWFEAGLAYDNARLPQALMLTGMATKTPAYVDAGLKSLPWRMNHQ